MSLLVAEHIAKRFGGVQALNDVSFTIRKGDIYGLIGPNGAGKTTLFNVLTGIYAPDGGGFRFDEQHLVGLKAHQVAAAGSSSASSLGSVARARAISSRRWSP